MRTILVVDDDPKIRSVLGRGLRFEGYDVHLARNGNEALSIPIAGLASQQSICPISGIATIECGHDVHD
jgi:DNA-binding NtrC family response regulator